MRSHHIIAVALVLVVGVGVKIFFFSPRAVETLLVTNFKFLGREDTRYAE
jgi:hypothetical protein